MWFIGLIIGGIIGAVGGFSGAIAGAILGAVAASLLAQKSKSGDEDRLATIEDAIRQLNDRLKALEAGAPRAGAGGAAAASDSVPDSVKASAAGFAPAAVAEAPPPANELEPAQAVAAEPAAESVIAAAPIAVAETVSTPPAAPSENVIVRWFTGGNTLVRVGVVLLFFGVAFLLKYAAEHGYVPIELRIAGVAAGGIALLVLGWRLRTTRSGYALMLQGAGVGILYLTVFAALRLYRLVPAELAFVLLAGIAVFSAILAVAQDSRSLAVTGAAGGFLAPVLASTGTGNHVALFSFYAVLNAGILFIAWHKAWRILNLVGFAFTFVIGLAWGAKYYRPELFGSTEPFLALFFLMYVAIAVLFALREAPRLVHYVDGTLVFGVPLIAFGLQTALVRDTEFGAAWSALALAAFYLTLATVLYQRRRDSLRLLVESFLALGIGFATLAVPLAFEGRLTSAVWAVEGAAIVWISVRQRRLLGRVFGMLLQPAAGVAFLAGADAAAGSTPVLNSLYLGAVMVSVAALFCAFYLRKNAERLHAAERVAGQVLLVWGASWWFGAGVGEILRHSTGRWGLTPYLLFFGASCCGYAWLARRLEWRAARYVALAVVPLSVLVLLVMSTGFGAHRHPFAHHGYAGWLLVFGAHLWALRLQEQQALSAYADSAVAGWMHSAGFWLLAVVLSWEVGWQIDHYVEGQRVWPLIAWAIVPGGLIATFAARGADLGWPVARYPCDYLYRGALPLVAFLLFWVLYVNFRSNGDPAPLPYVPLLNPLDIAQIGALLALAAWYLHLRHLELPGASLPTPLVALRVLGLVVFVALNGMLLRALHHHAGVPFDLVAMLRSNLVQAAFSLFWSLLAFAAMVAAARRGLRALWFVGAALLAVVVGKLFLVDLANTGTMERVVSFIGVGVLIIVIGYFAPVPPKSGEAST